MLGTRILNGKGDILSFGGEVMKNVAGYDVSRLITGAMGTLGVLLEISLKVVPSPEAKVTLLQQRELPQALQNMHDWARQPLRLSASSFHDGNPYIRLSGTAKGVQQATQVIGGEPLPQADACWQAVKQQQHVFFQ